MSRINLTIMADSAAEYHQILSELLGGTVPAAVTTDARPAKAEPEPEKPAKPEPEKADTGLDDGDEAEQSKPAKKKATKKKASKKKAAKKAEDDDDGQDEGQVPTLDELREATLAFKDAGADTETIRDLIKAAGGAKLSEIPENKRAYYLETVQARTEEFKQGGEAEDDDDLGL